LIVAILISVATLLPFSLFGQPSKLVAGLGFELARTQRVPPGWAANEVESVDTVSDVVHDGTGALRIKRTPGRAGYSSVTMRVPDDAIHSDVELRGYLRTDSIDGFAGLWIRIDTDAGVAAFENMQNQRLNGTSDWKQYSVKVPYKGAATVTFGVLLTGGGTVWADDLSLVIDGEVQTEAPPTPSTTALETDDEFNAGSGVNIDSLTKQQVQNLSLLSRVWGFLKYHHPAVTGGQYHWDFELFRVLPKVLAAPDRKSAEVLLVQWVDSLGPISPCSPCAELDPAQLQLRPDTAWFSGERPADAGALNERLREIYENRAPRVRQSYLSIAPSVGNALFDHELPYSQLTFPDSGYRLLAVFRLWNIINYWYPYRDLIDGDWGARLSKYIPEVVSAKNAVDYQLVLLRMLSEIKDSHTNLGNGFRVRPPQGTCGLPVDLRFAGREAVVAALLPPAGISGYLHIGDVVESIGGMAVKQLVRDWQPYYGASNDASLLRDIGRVLARGACGEVDVTIRRDNSKLALRPISVELSTLDFTGVRAHDLPGETFQLLAPDIGYLKLSAIDGTKISEYLAAAVNTRALIVDVRGIPAAFVVRSLASHFIEHDTAFIQYAAPVVSTPGAFRRNRIPLQPTSPHYAGKVVVLVDEITQSQGEAIVMALQASPNAVVIGSQTAGADGDISTVVLPGDIRAAITGLGVFYPDGKPTQQIGIRRDVSATRTVQGIKLEKDEILEAATKWLKMH